MESKENFDYRESILEPEEQNELNELRRLQGNTELTEEQIAKLKELTKKEEALRTGKPGLTEAEETELRELRKKQYAGGEWTKEDAEKLIELQNRK